MRKMLLKIRIFLTNVSRVIMGLLFVNLKFSYLNKVFGSSLDSNEVINSTDNFIKKGPTVLCYEPVRPDFDDVNINEIFVKNIIFIFVPLAIIIGFIILIIKKKKNKHKEDERDDKKD